MAAISFSQVGSFDNGTNFFKPTSLQFGPDGRLYVAELNGTINAFTVELQNGEYVVTAQEKLVLPGGDEVVKSIQNHNDDGTVVNPGDPGASNNIGDRLVTGIIVTGTATNPVLYVSSADPRRAEEEDRNLDTNSGVVSRVTWTGTEWDVVDIIRGLPRSEENHSLNGMELSPDGSKLYLSVGGNTNNGAPGEFFAYTAEYALSGSILEIDLNDINNRPILTDPTGGQGGQPRKYVYDLPTLDDPSVANNGTREDANGLDVNGPWGGNDGFNQAILPSDAPLRIYADGLRNNYDLEWTTSGELYTVDNGSNGPIFGGNPVDASGIETDQPGAGPATNLPNNNGSGDPEPLFLIEDGGYYGHPNPIRSNQDLGWIVYDDHGNPDASLTVNTTPDVSALVPNSVNIQNGYIIDPSKFTSDPTRLTESGVRVERSSPSTNAIASLGSSSNGLVEYTANAFDGALQGALLVTQFNGNVTLLNVNDDGTGLDPLYDPGDDEILGTADDVLLAADGIYSLLTGQIVPLDVTVGPDGTVWVANFGGKNITVFAPGDSVASVDFDGDGVLNIDDPFIRDATNGTGILNGTQVDDITLSPGETLLWDFDEDLDGNLPGSGGYGGGLTGVMIDGVTNFEDFFQEPSTLPNQVVKLDNVKFITALGGGTTVVENVSNGDPLGTSNNGEYLFHTGLTIDPSVNAFTVEWSVLNQPSLYTGATQQIGGYLGTGDQSNYLKIVSTQDPAGEIQVLLEDNDVVVASSFIQADDLFTVPDGAKIFFQFEIDPAAATATPTVIYETSGNNTTTVSGSAIDLTGTAVLNTILGNNTIQTQNGDTLTTGLAVGLLSSNVGQSPTDAFVATFDDIKVTAAANRVTIAPATNAAEPNTDGQFSVNISEPATDDVTVAYTVTGSATAGADYTALSGTVVIPAGSLSVTIDVPVLDDSAFEGDEDIIVTLDSVTSVDTDVILGEITAATVTIADDEGDPNLVTLAAIADATEPAGNGQFTVSLEQVAATDTILTYTVAGDATPGDDYTALSGTVTIPAGSLSATIDVAVLDDLDIENIEGVEVTLDSITAGDIDVVIGSANTATVNVIDDDNIANEVTIAVASGAAEPSSDGQFTVNLTQVAATNTVVSYTVAGSATPGTDYTALSGTVTIPAGSLSAPIDVAVLNDLEAEGAEDVIVVLDTITAGDSNVSLGATNSATLTLDDDDIGVTIAALSDAGEPNTTGQFIVSLSETVTSDTTIAYSVTGSATAGTDYTPLTGTVIIPAGASSALIDVVALDDTVFEGDEDVVVTLDGITAGASNIVVGAANTATVTIIEDEIALPTDLELTKTVDNATPDVGDTVTFTLTVDNIGTNDATGVAVENLLGSGFTYVSDTSGGDFDPITGVWDIGGLLDGASTTIDITTTLAAPTPPPDPTVLYRINVGGAELTAADGSATAWAEDTNTNPSGFRTAGSNGTFAKNSGTIALDNSVPNSVPVDLFRTQRFDGPSFPEMQWEFAVDPGTEVEVRLYFAEIAPANSIANPGDRVFDVAVEGSVPTAFDDIDPLGIAGSLTGFMLSETVTVTDGTLNLEFLRGVENPSIQGIEILEVDESANADPYATYAQILTADQPDPDSTPGDNSVGDDDDAAPTVTPNLTDVLSLSINPASVSENGGTATATVTRGGDTSVALTVTLTSDDTTAATVPATVVIPAGQASATFTVTAVDDALLDGTQTPTITAAATGLTDGTATLDVVDDEAPGLSLSLDATSISENGGTATAILTRTGDISADVTVTLSSSDTTGATVPATVTILAGQASTTFPVTAVDDAIVDGTQTTTITAIAAGLTDGTAVLDVTDDEVALPADLELLKTVDNTTPEVGDTITFTLTVNNTDANNDASGVAVQDLLPSGFTYVSDNSSGDYNPATGVWDVGAIAANGSATLDVTVTVEEPIPPSDPAVLYRINVGGGQLAAADGSSLVWSEDTNTNPSAFRVAGQNGIFTKNFGNITLAPSVADSAPVDLFRSQRFDGGANPEMQWEFAVDPGTEVEVRLYFAEIASSAVVAGAGARVFDVAVEGAVPAAFDDIDPYAIAGGPLTGFMLTETVTVTDGVLDLDFIRGLENPSLQGIEIVEAGTAVPANPYSNYAQILTSNQPDPDSTPGDDSVGDDDDATVVVNPTVPDALSLTINPASVSENGGVATATVTRNTDTTNALTVTLSSSDTTGATVPATVTIPAGQASATFPINAVDDTALDGTQTPTITATAAGLLDGVATLDVTDDEVAGLTLSINPASIAENGGVATATVTRNTDTTNALTVTLNSSDTSEATVPTTVTILAGETTASFQVTAMDDAVVDGTQTPTITATATGLADGIATLDVTDDEVAVPADLELLKTVDNTTPTVGDTVTFTLTVNNSGTGDSTGVSVADLLPSGFTYVSDTSGGDYNATTGIWDIGSVANGGTTSIDITATVNAPVPFVEPVALYRVNVGGGQLAAADGSTLVWSEDTNTNPSAFRVAGQNGIFTKNFGNITVDAAVPNSVPTDLFRTMRFDGKSNPDMQWEFAVDPGTEVEVRLYLAEIASSITGAGERVFDVAIEGMVPTSFDDIDAFGLVGGALNGIVIAETVTVTDGILDIDFVQGLETPIVNGIEILQAGSGPIDPTPYDNYAQILTVDQPDPDSTPGDDSTGDDDDATVTLNPTVPEALTVTLDATSASENGGTATATVTRSGDTSAALTVTLSSSDTSEATVPASVVIPAGVAATTFAITAVDDTDTDGTQTPTITASATGLLDGVATFEIIDDESPSLSLSLDATSIAENGGLATATVTRTGDTTNAVTVTLSSSDTSAATVPATIAIPAGQASATFAVNAVDDALLDGTQTANITATATGLNAGAITIDVLDDEVPGLSLSLDTASIPENGGTATATLTRTGDTSSDVTVSLSSSDISAATVPTSVVILAGQPSTTFAVTAVDDPATDGMQTSTITASAAGLIDGTVAVDVTDDDIPMLSLSLDASSIAENGGTATATVTRDGDTSSALTVTLASSDTTEATVPATVEIPAGQASATFTVTGVDDALADGTETATITATAAGLADGTAALDITDDEVATPEAALAILPGTNLLTASTFTNDSFVVTNQSGNVQIEKVVLNTSNALLPKLVFDPTGTAGDSIFKGLEVNSGGATTGFVVPANNQVDPFTDPLGNGGFRTLELNFTDFDPGETITFSVDTDPTNIEGDNGAGSAGAISGTEMVNSTATVHFSDGSILTSEFFTDGSLAGAETVVNATPATPLTIDVVDVTLAPDANGFYSKTAEVADVVQQVKITGQPGQTVELLLTEASGEPGDINGTPVGTFEPFEANTVVQVSTQTATLDANGEAILFVNLTKTANPDKDVTGINLLTAAPIDGSGVVSGPVTEAIALQLIDPDLTLTIDPVILSEGGTATATLTRNASNDPFTVNLSSSDTTEATVPQTVSFAAGETTTTFTITAVDDILIDGVQTPAITASAVGLTDGVATLTVNDNDAPTPDSFLFTVNQNATLGGLAVTPQDIVQYDGTDFSLFFDGSDVGVTSVKINAFDVISSTEILLSFDNPIVLPNIGATDDSDVVRFTGSSFGENTIGTYSKFIDGSDVALGAGGEDIDALVALPDGTVLLSTTGNVNLGSGVIATDEDVLLFTPTALGNLTAGSFSMFIDGSDIGLTSADIDGFSIDDSGNYYFSATDPFTVGGVSGEDEDVFIFTPTATGDTTSGSFDPNLFFDGSGLGLTKDVQALDLTFLTVDDIPALTLSIDPANISENGGVATATVTRTGDTSVALTVTLDSSDTDEATVPNSVVIPAGQASATFQVTAVDELIIDGTQSPAITASADGLTDGIATLNVVDDDEVFDLTVSLNTTSITENGGTTTATVTRGGDTSFDLTVTLTSSDTTAATVPATVVIPAGQAAATFTVNSVDDAAIDGTQTAAITATAQGMTDGVATIEVTDDDAPLLTLSLDSNSIAENGDTATATITRDGDTSAELTVNLTSSDTGEASVPATVVIPAGQASATFQVTGVDDADIDGTQTATITANATGMTNGTIAIDITDDDAPEGFLFTLNSNFTLGGIATTTQDIVQYDGTDFSLFFDGSDIGLNAGKINAFDVISETEILLSFDGEVTIAGLGTVDDSDIVKFTATSLGDTTAGSFELYFDGSDVGLATGGEDIDALTQLSDGSLLISTTGNLNIGSGVIAVDDDITRFTPTSTGDTTAGSFSLYVDGSDISLAPENVDGFSIDPVGDFYFSVTGDFAVPGVAGDDEDVFVFTPASTGSPTTGSYASNLFFDGSQSGLQFKDIQGIDLTFPTPTSASTLSLSVNPGSVSENGGVATATVTRDGDTSAALTVTLASSDISAATVPATVVIPAGQAATTFDITGVDDAAIDGTQTPMITAAATGFIDGTVILDITDDEIAALSISVVPGSFSENGGVATATVTRNGNTSTELTVNLTSSDTTAATVPATVVIPAGQAAATFDITGVDDAVIDGTQTPTITATATGLTDGTTTVDVTDDDVPNLSLSFADSSISENGGATTATVTRSGDTSADVTVNLASSDTDEATVPATVLIPAGQTTATFNVTGVDDVDVDGTQTPTFTATAAGLVDGVAVLDVTDDDGAPELSIDDVLLDESAGTAIFTVSLSKASTSAVTVDFTTVDGTADDATGAFNSNDYDATSGTLTFNPGDLTQTIAVNLYEDLAIEGDEAFMVDLSNAAGATIADDSGTATITDNDGTQLSTSSLLTYDFTGTNSQAASFSLFPSQGDSLIGVVATANEEGMAKDVFRSNKGFGVAGETDGSFNDEIDGKGPNGANDGSGGLEELVLTFDSPVKLETLSFTSSNGDDDYIILAGVNQLTTGVSATSPKFLPLDVSTFNGTGTEFTFTVVSDTGSDDYALAGIQVSAI